MTTGIASKREVLIAARLRFSPEAQSVREAAIDGLVKQSLTLAESTGLSVPQLEQGVARDVGSGGISRTDVKAALTRLTSSGEVTARGHGLDGRKYRLTPTAQGQVVEASRLSRERIDRVVDRCFRHAPGGSSRYSSPFVTCLAILFSRVADIYIRLLKGEIERQEFAAGTAVQEALDETLTRYSSIDRKAFARGVYSFLTEIEPEYDEIKFNMIQNYYISRMLGLDEAGRLLSREMFGKTIVYLDTNVFFHALEPRASLYHQFQTLSVACSKLGVQLRVCQISLDEHRAVISYHRDLVDKVEDQIPEETSVKVGSLFYQAYLDAKRKDRTVTTDQVFARFAATREGLSEQHGVELIDDGWFDKQRKSQTTLKLAEEIQKQYAEFRPGRAKRDRAAIHDALLLEWVERERSSEDSPVWLVTLDSSVCGFFPDKSAGDHRPLGITLDAFLQWISPVAAADGLEGGMREIFALALKYQLLPPDRFLDLDDFLLFAEMEWSCKDLPAEDVEKCVQYLRQEASGLDMTKPADREKVARDFAKFFLDPARKYQQNLQDLERALEEKDAKLLAFQREADTRYEALREEHQRQLEERETAGKASLEDLRADMRRALEERDTQVGTLAEEVRKERAEREREQLRRSGYMRLFLVLLVFIGFQIGALILSDRFDFLPPEPLFVAALALTLFFGWVLIGRERLGALAWPIRKAFRVDSEKPGHQ
jgi:hypothetical protein